MNGLSFDALKQRIGLCFLCAIGLAACSGDQSPVLPKPWADTEVVRVHAPDVSGSGLQQDLYLIEFRAPGEQQVQRFLIDAGDEVGMRDQGLPYLQRQGIDHLDRVYITHPHKDHYGGLNPLFKSPVTVGQLVMNRPLAKACDAERPWGCDLAHIEQTLAAARERSIEHTELFVDDPTQPLSLWRQDGAELSLWFAPRPEHPALGEVGINDMSMFMRLQVGERVHWFTGDMNVAAGDFLLTVLGPRLKGDVLKVPHHGAESTVSDAFLAAVAPTQSWVPTHAGLWCSLRSQRVRDWLQEHRVANHVMGLHGDTLLHYFRDREPLWQTQQPLQHDCHAHLAKRLEAVQTDNRSVASVGAGVDKGQRKTGRDGAWVESWYALDKVTPISWAGVPALQVVGWQIAHDTKARAYAPAVALLSLDDGAWHVFDANVESRPDVVKHFGTLKLPSHDVGFGLVLPTADLPKGRYELALVRHQHPNWQATKTGRTLLVTADGVVLE